METLKDQLMRYEGLRLKPYRDLSGKLTIGFGRNLDDTGITEDEALKLLENDISRATAGLKRNLPYFDSLDEVRRNVLINMAFNLGIRGLLGFSRMLCALRAGDYKAAAEEMLRSKWAVQTGSRAGELSNLMRNGS